MTTCKLVYLFTRPTNPRWSGLSVLHPFITAIVVIIGVIILFDIPYRDYREGARILDFLLGPSVVALALRLYDNIEIVKKNLAAILAAVITGSAVGILGVWALGRFMGCDSLFIKSMEAKSVTTPIAMELTAVAGGSTPLIAISVVLPQVSLQQLRRSTRRLELGLCFPIADAVSMIECNVAD